MAAQDLAVATTEAVGIIPELSVGQWLFVAFVLILAVVAVALVVWAVWDRVLSRKNDNYYHTAYREFISLCINNCPPALRGKNFLKAADELNDGVIKGKIVGYNLLKFANSYYDVIIYNPNPFSMFNPSSWFSPDRVALMNADKETKQTGTKKVKKKIIENEKEKEIEIEVPVLKIIRDQRNRPTYKWHSPLVGNVTWYTIGTRRIGYFEYAVNDLNLTPIIVTEELTDHVGLTAATGLLKELGELVGSSLHANPDIRGKQRLTQEVTLPRNK